MDDVTVLMTGAGAPGASGVIKSLRVPQERTVSIVGVDMDPDAYGFTLVDEAHTVPDGMDDEYVPRMRELVDEVGADVVLPLTNPELEPLAAQKDELAATVMVSGTSALTAANDKGNLYGFLADAGLDAAPDYRRIATSEAFTDAVSALGYPDNPVCFKRPVASGKRGFRVLDPRSDRLEHLLYEKPDSSVTTLEDVMTVLDQAPEFPELVVMEYLPGAEYSVDVLAMDGTVGPVIPRERKRTRAGITFEGTVEKREDLIVAATEICERLELSFNVNLQFKYDADGTPKLIEINPRISGTIVLCVGAGVNLPYLGVKYALREELPPVDVQWGTSMTRYWQEIFYRPDGSTYTLEP